jgi:hypothetical protein
MEAPVFPTKHTEWFRHLKAGGMDDNRAAALPFSVEIPYIGDTSTER